MTDDEKACVLSLLHAHVSDGPEYVSWVPAYTTLRQKLEGSVRVGGHYRRKALCRNLISALKCTAKFYDVSRPPMLCAPPGAARRRWEENGRPIRVSERQLEFF
jgi:hypothetical protein